jgi:pterin-4a-carbinolamine dehydratase
MSQQAEVVVEKKQEKKAARASGQNRVRQKPRPELSKLKPERIQEELAAMPGWRLTSKPRGIERLLGFPSPAAAGAYASFVSELADAVGQRCTVSKRGDEVTVLVYGRPRIGITTSTLDFARRLS